MADGRAEGSAWRVARALGGALLRVGRAVPDYLAPAADDRALAARVGDGDDEGEDTGEWPAPGAEDDA